jgi:hypothetical protein
MLPEVQQFAKIIGSVHNCFASRHPLSARVSEIKEASNCHDSKHSMPSVALLAEDMGNLHSKSLMHLCNVWALIRLVSN